MNDIYAGCAAAVKLILSCDAELIQVGGISLTVALAAVAAASLAAIPLGMFLALKDFFLKKALVRLMYLLMNVPTVVVGLLVFMLFARRGPLGFFEIIFTPWAMIIADFCLVFPIITALVYAGSHERAFDVRRTAHALGAGRAETCILVVRELRFIILSAVMTAFARAISEVGAAMLVGGNIRWHTRTMTTAISMLQNMGEYAMSIALAIVLLLISFAVNMVLFWLQGKSDA